jgi:uncharacterized membrane protein
MVCQSDWLPITIATDFAPGGANAKIPCPKEAANYRPARWSSKASIIAYPKETGRTVVNGYYYLPLTPAYFAILVGLFLLAAILLVSTLRYAYLSLGMSSGTAMLLLFASLIGSYVNIPIAHLPPEQLMSDQVRDYFGMYWVIPHVRARGPEIAVNVGGAVIPTIVSLYLLFTRALWLKGLLATAIVALVLHWLAHPVQGVGIAVPIFLPALVTAIVAWLLAGENAAPLAYVAGSMGTLIGADLTNLEKVRGLGAPVASIGGAGTFDGIFLTGILAVLLASLYHPRHQVAPPL